MGWVADPPPRNGQRGLLCHPSCDAHVLPISISYPNFSLHGPLLHPCPILFHFPLLSPSSSTFLPSSLLHLLFPSSSVTSPSSSSSLIPLLSLILYLFSSPLSPSPPHPLPLPPLTPLPLLTPYPFSPSPPAHTPHPPLPLPLHP